MQIVHVLNVSANQMMSYPVVEKQTLQELQRILSEETKIPVEEQEILLASGITPDPEKPAAQCWSKPVSAMKTWLLITSFKIDSNGHL